LTYEYVIDIDHAQLFIEDEGAWKRIRHMPDQTDDLDLVASAPGILAIETARVEGNVRVVIELMDHRPVESLDPWDHVVECGIKVSSGRIRLMTADIEDESDAPRIELPPGSYRALIYFGNQSSVPYDDPYGGEDYYRIALWPGDEIGPKVLKRDMKRYEEALRERQTYVQQAPQDQPTPKQSAPTTRRASKRRRFLMHNAER
jgi:hypothetical protein